MKKRLSTKLLSLFLAVIMVVTSIPFTAITASAATANEIYDGLDAEFKSHQVGFFFSDASTDPTYNKISGKNKLSGSGATWDSAVGGFKFNGDNADHLYIKASDILGNVTSETGFTIHFEAKSLSYDWQRYFDFMCSEPLGTGNTYYLCASPNSGGKVCVKHSDGASGYLEMEQIGGMNTSDGQWHTYTIAVSNSTVEVWVDGKAYASKQDGLIDSEWFNTMRDNGYIRFGISAFSADPAFDGWMKNVHIYDTAYTEPAYLFAYFTGDDDQADAVNQRIRFALSKDGVNFTSINGNAPILKNDQVSGTITWNNKTGMAHTKGVRDPFIIKKVNEAGYFVVATDLRVGNNGGSYNNSKIVVWDINDLSKADKAIPWNVETSGMFGSTYYSGSTINKDYIAWAPEVTYDYQNNIYMMYWSGPLYNNSTILCAYTHDFKTFYQDPKATKTIDGNTVKPETLFSESGKNVIDADIVFDGENYYMVYKRESEKQLYFVKASTIEGLTSQTGTRFYDSRFTGANGNGEGLEGPELYKNADGKWTLIADNYTANTGAGSKGIFYMYQVDSLDEFMTGADCSSKSVSTNISDCSPRHGSVTTISSGVYASLNKEFGGVSDAKGALVARYFTSSDTTADTSGNGYTMSFPNGGISYVPEFNGVKNCVHFDATTSNTSSNHPLYARVSTKQMMADYNFNYYDGLTMTWKAYDEGNDGTGGYTGFYSLTEQTNATPGTLTLDETDWTHLETAYAFLLGGMSRGVSSGTPGSSANGSTEYTSDTMLNQWVDYKLVIAGKGYKVYRNGTLAYEMSVPIITQQWYLDLFTNGTLLLGTTLFANDKNYKGYMADFRIYATGNQDSVKALEEEVAKDDIRKEYEIAKANLNADTAKNAKAESFSFITPKWNSTTSTVESSYHSNLIYTSDTSIVENSNNNKNVVNVFKGYKTLVAIDNGSTIKVPVVMSLKRDSSWSAKGNFSAMYLRSTSATTFSMEQTWQGYDSASQWPTDCTEQQIGYTAGTSNTMSVGNDTARNFKNYIKYNGTSNTDTFYDIVSSVDYTSYWKDKSTKDLTLSGINWYFINYKPIQNILNNSATNMVIETGKSYTFKVLYNEVYPNQWMYTEDSVQAYLVAVNKLVSLDLSSTLSDANDSNVDAKVKASALAIKEAYNDYTSAVAYLKKKTINVDFTFADGSVTTKTINAGDTLNGIIPANTKAQYNNNKFSHMSYTWSEGCVASHQPQSDEAYFEVFATNECSFVENITTPATCEDAGLANYTCSVCGGKYTDTVAELGHAWGSTYTNNKNGTHSQTCTRDSSHVLTTPCNMVVQSETDTQTVMACNICGYSVTTVKLNRTAYNNAVDAARAVILNETAKYSADSLKALQAVLNQAATDSLNAQTQDALDEITAKINAANSTDTANGGVLVANTFRITYGNMFDYNEFMNSDSKNISNPEWGRIDFDIANQVFTVIGNGAMTTDKDGNPIPANDVYSAYAGAKTYKIPVSDSKSYTFEFTAKGTTANQAFVFFYNENGTALNVGENFKYTYNGTEYTAGSSEYFVNHYGTPDGETTKLTFTPPAGTVKVDFRFGLTDGKQRCDFYNIGFYETSKADSFIVADNVEYGTDFGAIAISTPDVDGMHFGGWFVDKECTTSVTTIETVTENINLHAKLDPYVESKTVGCTLVNNGYTVYVCSGGCADSEMKAYDDKLLDGTTNGYWDAYNNLVALVTAEEGNNYANYTEDSVNKVKTAYTTLHETACASYKQAEVDGYANDMKAIINQLVVKVNFVTKTDGGVETTETKQVEYNGALDIFNFENPKNYTTVEGRYTWTFSGWDKTPVTANITTGATYVAQYTSVDHLDRSAYDAAVASAQASIANTAKYTETSRNNLRAVLDNSLINENTTIAAVNAYISAIQTAINQLVLRPYTVKYYVIENGTPKGEPESFDRVYGDVLKFELDQIKYPNYVVEKWVRTDSNKNDHPIVSSSNMISYTVDDSSSIYVHIKSIASTNEENKSTVFLKDKIGKIFGSIYLTTDQKYTVTISGSTITIDGQSMTAPQYAFYNVVGFKIGNVTLTNGQEIAINENTTILPIYEAIEQSKYTITAKDCTINGVQDSYKAKWDEKILVTNPNAKAWKVNGVIVAYGSSYVFRATSSVTLECVTDKVDEKAIATVDYLTYGGYRDKTITAVGSYKLPEGATFVETGVILKTSKTSLSAVQNIDNYKKTNVGGVFKANNIIKDTKQFTINVYASADYQTLYVGAVTYVVYKDSNGEHVTYSDEVTTYSFVKSNA